MIDWVKCELPSEYADKLLNSPLLNFSFNLQSQTGEIVKTKEGYERHFATFQGFKIVVWKHSSRPCNISFKGSFHQRFEGGTNFQDFSFEAFKKEVSDLSLVLGIPVNQFKLHGFEFGVNISPPIESMRLIEGIKSKSGKKFERETFKGEGLMLRFTYAQYIYKIYDKGLQLARLQNGSMYNAVRLELRVTTMQYLLNKGVKISTLQDLISGTFNKELGDLLLRNWEQLILCPEGMVNPEHILNPRSKRNFIKGLNPDYWSSLDSKARNRKTDSFRREFSTHSVLDLYKAMPELINDKWHELTLGERGKNYPLVIDNFIPLLDSTVEEYQFCITCGRDITKQKKGSKFCSELLYGKEAKQCRNKNSNPRNNNKSKRARRLIREQKLYPGLTLFPAQIHFGILAESPQNVSLTVHLMPLRPLNQTQLYDLRPIYNQYKPTL